MSTIREKHQRDLERGITLQIAPELKRSEAWRRVRLAAHIDGCTVAAIVADGIMAAVESREDDRQGCRSVNTPDSRLG